MKKHLNFTMVFSILMLFYMNISTVNAQSWEPTNGPYGGAINCYSHNNSYLFVGVGSKGVFRSNDSGTTWAPANQGLAGTALGVSALVASESCLIASTGGGIYYSVNNGDSWYQGNYPGLYNPYCFYFDGTTYFAGGMSGLYVSNDNGATWVAQNDNFQGLTPPTVPEIRAMAVSGNYLYAGTYKKGIFRSGDGGLTWKTVNDGLGTVSQLNSRAFSTLVVQGEDIFTGTSGQGVFRLIGNGTTWTNEISGLPTGQGRYIMTLMLKEDKIYCGGNAGLFCSNNQGVMAWSASNGDLGVQQFRQLFLVNNNIYAGISSKGIYISTDNTTTWSISNQGIQGLSTRFITKGLNNDILVSTYEGNIYSSPDEGANWNIGSITAETGPYLHGNSLFVGTGGECYRSTDNGTTWVKLTEFINVTWGPAYSFYSKGDTLFAGCAAQFGLYYTTDNGESWNPTSGIWNLNPNGGFPTVLSITSVGSTMYAGTKNSVFKSTDNGLNWTACNPAMADLPISTVVVSGNSVFAATCNYYSIPNLYPIGIYRSDDNGTSWSPVNNGLANLDIFSLVLQGTDLYAGSTSGIYKSIDNGANWSAINEGYPNLPFAKSLFVKDNYIYSGNFLVAQSVYRRALSGTPPDQPSPIEGNTTPCVGSTETYSVTNVEGITYAWQFPSGWTIVEGSTTNAVTVITGSTSGFIIVTPSNGFGTGPAQVMPVTPSTTLPASVSIVASNNPGCPGTIVTFTATPVNGGTPSYQWYVNSIAVGEDNAQYSYIPEDGDEVQVVMTSSLGCVTNNPASSNTIVMSVIACQPWNFTVTSQVHTINIPASANPNINGTPLAAGTWIGVFFVDETGNEQCAGAVQWNLQGSVVNAYGNDPTTPEKDGFATGETFRWRIYDMNTLTEYPAGATYDALMPNQGNFADFGLSKLTSLQVMICQNYAFTTGWNSISSYITPFDPTVETIFAPMADQLTIMRNLTSVYWPGENINTIGNFDNQSGYALKVNSNVDFDICGAGYASRDVSLTAGWHYLPVLSECPANAMDLFGSHLNDIVIIQDLIGTKVFWPAMNVYSLETLEPGKAYKIKVLNPFTVTFPSCSGKSSTSSFSQINNHVTRWGAMNMTPATQTIAFTTNALSEMVAGDVIGAFDQNNNLFGYVEVTGNNDVQTITLFGDDATTNGKDGFAEGENISFRLYRATTGENFELEVVYDNTIDNYSGSYLSGSLSAVTTATMSVTGIQIPVSSEVSIYPNPADDEVVITISDETFNGAQIRLTDTKGSVVLDSSVTGTQTTLDISKLRPGVYFVSIKSNLRNEMSKLIIR